MSEQWSFIALHSNCYLEETNVRYFRSGLWPLLPPSSFFKKKQKEDSYDNFFARKGILYSLSQNESNKIVSIILNFKIGTSYEGWGKVRLMNVINLTANGIIFPYCIFTVHEFNEFSSIWSKMFFWLNTELTSRSRLWLRTACHYSKSFSSSSKCSKLSSERPLWKSLRDPLNKSWYPASLSQGQGEVCDYELNWSWG